METIRIKDTVIQVAPISLTPSIYTCYLTRPAKLSLDCLRLVLVIYGCLVIIESAVTMYLNPPRQEFSIVLKSNLSMWASVIVQNIYILLHVAVDIDLLCRQIKVSEISEYLELCKAHDMVFALIGFCLFWWGFSEIFHIDPFIIHPWITLQVSIVFQGLYIWVYMYKVFKNWR